MRLKICSICGRVKINGKCPNEFCQNKKVIIFKGLNKYFGFDLSKVGTIEVETEFYRIRDMVYDLYWTLKKGSSELTEMFGYPNVNNFACYIRKILYIETKTLSYATKEQFAEGRHEQKNNDFKYCKKGIHKTWDDNEVYLRSSYEFDYATLLDEQKIHYEVESLHIKYLDTLENYIRIAVPDFYIPSTNTIVEIKSKYTLDSINMYDKFKEYKNLGYNAKLILEHKEIDIESIIEDELYIGDLRFKKQHYLKEHWIWMNKNGKKRKCNFDEIEKLLLDGWNFGIKPGKQVDDVLKYIENRPGPERRYIHKGDDVLLVLRKDIPKYLKDGWETRKRARVIHDEEYTNNLPNCQKRYIHKGDEVKYVSRYDVKRYLELGWERGRI